MADSTSQPLQPKLDPEDQPPSRSDPSFLPASVYQQSDHDYRALLDTMDEGFHISELIYDQAGQPIDWRYLEVNQVFYRETGLQNVVGHLGSQLTFDTESYWLQAYDQVLQTGQPIRLENYNQATDRWYSAHASRVGGADSRRFAVLFTDITQQKRDQQALRQSEQRQTFLLELSDVLRPLVATVQIQAQACRLLGEHLGVDRAYYVEVYPAQGFTRVAQNYLRGDSPSLVGTYALADYDWTMPLLQRGQTIVVDDTEVSELIPEADRAFLQTVAIRAHITTPLLKDGQLTGSLCVTEPAPRQWTTQEVELVRETAERIWAAIVQTLAEVGRRQSEEKFRSLFESMDEGFCIIEQVNTGPQEPIDFCYLEANSAFTQQSGVANVIGKTIREVVPGEAESWFQTYERVVTTGESVRFERVLETQSRTLELYAFRVAGEHRQVGVIFKDISERRRRDANTALLDQISNDLSRLSTPDSLMQAVSVRVGEALGLTGCVFSDVDEQKGENTVHYAWTQQGAVSLKQTFRIADYVGEAFSRAGHAGEVFIVNDTQHDARVDAVNYAKLQVGSFVIIPFHWLGHWTWFFAASAVEPRAWRGDEIELLTEIANRVFPRIERTRAEKALRDSDERLRTLVQNIRDYAIYRIDPNGLITEWTEGAQRVKGYSSDDVIGQHLSLFYAPEAIAAGEPATEMAEADRTGRAEREGGRIRKDGQRIVVDEIMTAIRDEQGRLMGFTKISRDVTLRRQAEGALREANRRKDEFLAMLAHELRNPMSTIRSGLNILTLTQGEDEVTSTTVAMMNRQTVHLVRMVDDLLDVSRISRGKIELHTDRLDLVELVSQATESVRGLFEEQGRRLQIDLPDAPIYVAGDATRLSQVVTNLLTNGVRYTGEAGQVWLRLIHKGREAIIEVRDNGIGLAADQLSVVFELFVQVDNSLARSKGGLGIGLTLVKQLAELHGGGVEVHSAGIGQGSTFTVQIPTLETAPEALSKPLEATTPQASSSRILVIDDNADAALSLSMLLKLKGYEVHTRLSGRAGIEAAEALQPAAILLDIGMPELDGYETCRLIRQQPWGRALVVIALTGYGQKEDYQRTQQAGFDGHLVKPVDLDALLQLLNSL